MKALTNPGSWIIQLQQDCIIEQNFVFILNRDVDPDSFGSVDPDPDPEV